MRAELAVEPGVWRAGTDAAQPGEPRARDGPELRGRGRGLQPPPDPGHRSSRSRPPLSPSGVRAGAESAERGARRLPARPGEEKAAAPGLRPATEGAPEPTSVTGSAPPPPSCPLAPAFRHQAAESSSLAPGRGVGGAAPLRTRGSRPSS